MLLAKPYFLYKEHQATLGAGYALTSEDHLNEEPHAIQNEDEDEHASGHGNVFLLSFSILTFRKL